MEPAGPGWRLGLSTDDKDGDKAADGDEGIRIDRRFADENAVEDEVTKTELYSAVVAYSDAIDSRLQLQRSCSVLASSLHHSLFDSLLQSQSVPSNILLHLVPSSHSFKHLYCYVTN